jgi:superfamily II DNA or RNA helicase
MIKEMNPGSGLTPKFPHHQRLLDAIQSHPRVNTVVARWATGAGAQYTGTLIAAATLHDSPNSRVLVLSPKVLKEQLQQRLAALGVPTFSGDRYSFRARQDAAESMDSLWAAGTAHVLSHEFARQDDISLSLSAVPWDLVLVFEGHRIAGDLRRAVERLLAGSQKAQLVIFTAMGVPLDFEIGREPRLESVFTLRDALSAMGNDDRLQRPTLHEVAVQATQAEAELGVEVSELVHALRRIGSPTSLLMNSVSGQVQSSPAALEDGLRRLRNRLAHGSAAFGGSSELYEETAELVGSQDLQSESEEIFSRVNRCLEKLDAVPSDSKLARLQTLLHGLEAAGPGDVAVSIFCRYRATVLYLKVALDDLGFPVHDLHGGMTLNDRMATISAFRERGGVLVTSPALASEGFDLPECRTLYLYDMPNTKEVAERLYGRFQRVGRKEALAVYAFVPNDALGPVINKACQISDLEALFSEGR